MIMIFIDKLTKYIKTIFILFFVQPDIHAKRIYLSKAFAPFFVILYKVLPNFFAQISIDLFRNSPFFWGYAIRYAAYKRLCKKMGNNVTIYPNVYAYQLYNLEIGNTVSIHEFSYIHPGKETIKIGDNVSMAAHLIMVTNDHEYDIYESGMRGKGNTFKPIIIEDNAWLGARCTLLGDAVLKKGGVLGANSLLKKATKENTIYFGSPSKEYKNFKIKQK